MKGFTIGAVPACFAMMMGMASPPVSASVIFDIEFAYTPLGICLPFPGFCPPNPPRHSGEGTIEFPSLFSPGPGVALDWMFTNGTFFTETDIQSITWSISADMLMLNALTLELDTDPNCTADTPDFCVSNYGTVSIVNNVGAWSRGQKVCVNSDKDKDNIDCSGIESSQDEYLATASPGIPAPATIVLLGAGLLGIRHARRKLHSRAN